MSKEQLYVKRGKKYEPVESYYNVNNEILLFCAFRYAIGRRTYVVSSVAESIAKVAPIMHDIEKEKYVKEIIEYYNSNNGEIGMLFDTELWTNLACFLDPANKFTFEANLYNTDKWVEAVGYKFNGKMYNKDGCNINSWFHTIRNVKGPENYMTSMFAEEFVNGDVEVLNLN